MTTPNNSHKAWTNEGGHVTGSPLKSVHGAVRAAMQDMIGGVVCPNGQAPNERITASKTAKSS
jgi:acyl-coenzyme A thioesterase PaaI-like protein